MPGSAAVATVTPPPTAAEERLLAAFQSANTLTSTYAASPERSVKSAKSAVFSRKHRSVKALLGGLPSSATSLRETRRSGRLPPPASGDDTAAGDEGHQQAPAPYHHHHHLFPRRGRGRPTRRDLDLAAQCGKFEQRPSDLFLEIYHDVLLSVYRDPFGGLVSPPLLGSTGVIPLSIISVIPDIIQHHANLIVKAEREVIFATNFWQASKSSATICDAFRELSRRAGKRNQRIVVKIMYDRGNLKQMWQPRQYVFREDYLNPRILLPDPEEMPNIDLEVINFHKPPVGTFHAKYMIVDRKVALLSSNNVQDRVNCEMCTHIEGPIVQSFYDTAIFFWGRKMSPPLPMLLEPTPVAKEYDFADTDAVLLGVDVNEKRQLSRNLLREQLEAPDKKRMSDSERRRLSTLPVSEPSSPIVESPPSSAHPGNGSALPAVNGGAGEHASAPPSTGSAPADGSSVTKVSVQEQPDGDEHWHFRRGWDPSNESERDRVNSKLRSAEGITRHLNTGKALDRTAPFSSDDQPFSPIVLHARHDPVPMAMVNRRPKGRPGHGDVHTPQDVAWLAALRYARKSVFIQTPNFNASHVVEAALAAVRRGVEVTLYLCMGFNDESQLLPYQGGTNSMVSLEMYASLGSKAERERLHIFYYVGKDQNVPTHATDKTRNCHIKLMVIDGQVGIQGNGNQDTQSWYHSAEVNVMVDSEQLCTEWMAAIESNQNTRKYGRVSNVDGYWRDKNGKIMDGLTPPARGVRATYVGVKGMIRRVRGEGGFSKPQQPGQKTAPAKEKQSDGVAAQSPPPEQAK